MKMILNTLMLTTMAVAGFAADNKLNFQVEFPFSVGKVAMPAGQYSIAETGNMQHQLQLTNVSAKRSVFINLPTKDQAKKTEATAQIIFRCADTGCSIAKVANLRDGLTYSAWTAKGGAAKMIAVNLTPSVTKAD